MPDKQTAPVVLAFSGGLDTSFCVPWLREATGRDVVTVTVDTGGLDDAARQALAERARALGATEHRTVDARRAFFDETLRWLIAGNVLRGQMYPLCVGAERGLQARAVAEVARALGATAVAHGCTAAGNDQVRFEVALRTLAPELEIIAPIRDEGFSREAEIEYLGRHGVEWPAARGAYSINLGLWGCTIGGRETTDTIASIPESAWVMTKRAFDIPRVPVALTVAFERGVPVALDGNPQEPVTLIEDLNARAGAYGIGRGIHLGDTIFGLKGRVAFEAPAAHLLIAAHRELEKLVLTGRQQRVKDQLASGLRRSRPRGAVPGPGLPRHRGALREHAGARDGRGAGAAATGRALRGGGCVAVLAEGRLARRLRRGGRRVDGRRRARLFAHARAAGDARGAGRHGAGRHGGGHGAGAARSGPARRPAPTGRAIGSL